MRPKVSLRRALSDPKLLGHVLRGPSWFGWHVLLLAASGERLTNKERVEFKRLTGRNREPGRMCRELILIFGRRGGKTLAVATFNCWIATCCDHRDVLAPGETGICLLISRDQRAAKIALDYIDGILRDSPVLKSLVTNRTADTIELGSRRINIEVRPCNRISSRGATLVSIIADEIGHWFTSCDFQNPDVEVLASAKPGLLTTRGPLLMASSVYAKFGVLFDSYRKHYGPDGSADILVAYGTSRDINPSLPQAEIDREIEADPTRNRAEYLSEWRDDTAGFIERAAVMACVGDYRELEPRPGVAYFCFLDAASGSENGDSYAIAIGHKDGDQIIIDAVREVIPPFSPASVVSDTMVPLCRAYRIDGKIFGDNYAGNFPKELVRKAGLYYDLWPQHKSELYRDPLTPLLNSKRITLPRIDRLVNQCCQLERSVKRSGRDEISHPTHGHDDLINAVAGVAAVVSRKAFHKQVPITQPHIYSKNAGWWTDPNLPAGAPRSPREIAQSSTPAPPGYNRPSYLEPWFPYVTGMGRWPGS
jgi:hypothetical protein